MGTTNHAITMIDADAPQGNASRIITFENFNLGDSAVDQPNDDTNESDRFDWDSASGTTSTTLIDNTHVFTGTKSAKLVTSAGNNKLGGGPGLVWTPFQWPVGTKVWMRMREWYPQAFIDAGGSAGTQGNKWMRWPSINNTNLHTIYTWPVSGAGLSPAPVMHYATRGVNAQKEFGTVTFGAPGAPQNGKIIPGAWNTIEQYIEVGHDNATSSCRVWKDNFPCTGWKVTYGNPQGPVFTPITAGGGYDFQVPFADDATDGLKGTMHYWTQWNGYNSTGGIDRSIDHWVDRLEIYVNVTPPNIDSNGFSFIGGL